MSAIVIHSENKENLNKILVFLKQMGEKNYVLTDEELEDFSFSHLIHKEKTGQKASREEVFNLLPSK